MTNGEKIQQDFACEVCEPIIEDDIIHVIFADKKDSAIGFDWSWWNMEYKEPTTKNDLGVDCISRFSAEQLVRKEFCNIPSKIYNKLMVEFDELPSVTPQEPKTGHWMNKSHLFESCSAECSACHNRSNGYMLDNGFSLECKYFDFCPNCGAKMVEPQESEVEDGTN